MFVGSFIRYLVDTEAGERLTVVRQNTHALDDVQAGTRIHLSWRPEDAYEIQQSPQEVK